jgi:hypothetical protein
MGRALLQSILLKGGLSASRITPSGISIPGFGYCELGSITEPSRIRTGRSRLRFAGSCFFALDHGVGSISDTGGATLTPFVITQDGSGRQLRRFVAGTFEDSVAMAQSHASSQPPSVQMVVLAFDGFVTVEGTRSDAVIVQAQRRGSSRGSTYAQRYHRDGSKVMAVGNVLTSAKATHFSSSRPDNAPAQRIRRHSRTCGASTYRGGRWFGSAAAHRFSIP